MQGSHRNTTSNGRGRTQWMMALALLLCAALCTSTTAMAQVLYGTITGTITDATNAAVPHASVTLTSQDTGEARTAQSDDHGTYLFVNLLPGQYTVSVKAAGLFSGYTQKNVAVEVNRELRIDAILQPASVQSEVTVNTSAPLLQTETAEVNHEISQSEISELPLTSSQGRNYQALYTLIPGFAAVGEQNSTASNPSRAESANVNGVTDTGVTTRIDGAINIYGWLAYLVAYVPPADAIQSVNIVTNSFNAEQGMAGGAAINVTIKGGQRGFHGSAWEYYQDAAINARSYTATAASLISATNPTGSVPKNVFHQFGGSIGGPVYIPHILTGRNKLFFFDDFERTTRRQLITATQTVPTAAMLTGDFSALTALIGTNTTSPYLLYDPQPGGVVQTGANSTLGYLNAGFRPTFLSEYGCNCIPAARQSAAAAKMLALLQSVSSAVTNPNYANFLSNDYNAVGTYSYNRNTNDAKITYTPNDRNTLFGRYSIEPFNLVDPQAFGAAGGAAIDGGQPGASSGRIQNVGIGYSHIISSKLVVDADGGYTRQVTGAQSLTDIADGTFGLTTLGIPGTNGVGPNYIGQPAFYMAAGSGFSNLFTPIGNSNGSNPFLFRDNQFTADVNVSWTRGKHSTKYGYSYYHFDLNHFQPTSGANINTPRGGFDFSGGMTNNNGSGNSYDALADFLLGLPNNGTNPAVAHPYQLSNPNTLRWTNNSAYAQDQWTVTPKLTLSYGVRYEFYPVAHRDHTGISRLDPSLPQSANVEIGGVNSNPEDTGVSIPHASFVPRLGVAYRVNERLVIRTGAGISTDADSMRYLRDSYPIDQAPSFSGTGANTIAYNPANNQALTLAVGIPNPAVPNISSGFTYLNPSGSTNTIPKNFRRGYIETWNLFVQQDLGGSFVMNVGYVGTHQVRQQAGYTLNAAPLPSGSTICMANLQYNPSTGLSGNCNSAANELVNTNAGCNATSTSVVNGATQTTGFLCYNTGGITMNQPLFSANYNGLQAQLTRNAGRLAQFGLIYTWSHAFDYDDNGAGTGSNGTAFSYPQYFKMNRATASYDRTNNVELWWIYHLPFGHGQAMANHGVASAVFGGFQLNGQLSHVSGGPFSVSPSSTSGFNSPGNTLYAQLVSPYRQLGGHSRTAGGPGGGAWFDPTVFANPVEPQYTTPTAPGYVACTAGAACNAVPVFANTHRNEFRGPGVTLVNASIFRGFHIYKESEFQIRVEAFNILNHALLNSNPNATVGGGTFGYITSFGPGYSPTQGARSLQFSGRISF